MNEQQLRHVMLVILSQLSKVNDNYVDLFNAESRAFEGEYQK